MHDNSPSPLSQVGKQVGSIASPRSSGTLRRVLSCFGRRSTAVHMLLGWCGSLRGRVVAVRVLSIGVEEGRGSFVSSGIARDVGRWFDAGDPVSSRPGCTRVAVQDWRHVSELSAYKRGRFGELLNESARCRFVGVEER